MRNIALSSLSLLFVLALSGCTRIETGEAGLRVDFNGTIQPTVVPPGIHQTLIGHIILFAAKEILLQEENLTPYVEGSLGRWFPVTKAGQQRDFWKADSHRQSVFNQYAAGTVTFEFTKNYKFTILNNENVWAKAMNRVVSEKVPVDKAVDELIARIKQVAG